MGWGERVRWPPLDQPMLWPPPWRAGVDQGRDHADLCPVPRCGRDTEDERRLLGLELDKAAGVPAAGLPPVRGQGASGSLPAALGLHEVSAPVSAAPRVGQGSLRCGGHARSREGLPSHPGNLPYAGIRLGRTQRGWEHGRGKLRHGVVRGQGPSRGPGCHPRRVGADPDISAPCQELPREPGSVLRLDAGGILHLPGAQPQVTLPGLGAWGGDTTQRGPRGSPGTIGSCKPPYH